jgi:CBS domain-containing protein
VTANPTGAAKTPAGESAQRSDIAKFLYSHAPFDQLQRNEVERVADFVEEVRVEPGETVLVENGPPGTHLFIVREGAMELVHRGNVVDVVTVGEVLGHPTLLSGSAPEFTARSRGETLLYSLPADIALAILSSPAGVSFVATTLRERLVRTARALGATPEVQTTPVSSLVRRSAVFCPADTPIGEAAKLMSREVVTALLVQSRECLGIVTDADLRDKVLAAGVSPEAPIASIMTCPVTTIRDNRLASEAAIEMMGSGVNHLPVVDAHDRVIGVISAGSLMTLDVLSPFAVSWSISGAGSEEELVEAAARLPRVFVALLDAHLDAPDVSRILTLLSDALTARFLDLAVERHGPAPVPYAWLALGSAARSEFTLASDQDNALAYADTDDPQVDAYFERVAVDVNEGLARSGFSFDPSGVLARDRHWRMSRSGWVGVFEECFEAWDHSHLMRAAVSFDFRRVVGALEIVPPLTDLLRQSPNHPGFLTRLARMATEIRSPLGHRQRLIGPVDLKKSAALPIENLARFLALGQGITVSSTLDRLAAVQALGGAGADTAAVLREVIPVISSMRLHHHADNIRAGRRPDNVIDPNELLPLARLGLQDALRAIADAQSEWEFYNGFSLSG